MTLIFLILALISGMTVIRVVQEIFKNRQHIIDENLYLLMRDDLDKKTKRSVINHLGQCLDCRNRLNELNGFEPHDF